MNRYHSEFPERKVSAKGGNVPSPGSRGGKKMSTATPYRCPTWGNKMPGKVSTSRSQGVPAVKHYAKSVGVA